MTDEKKLLTEYTKSTEYNDLVVKQLERVALILESVSNNPTYENLKIGFNAVLTYVKNITTYSQFYLKKFPKNVQPLLTDLGVILFGDMETMTTFYMWRKYNVWIENTKDGIVFSNPQAVLKEMREIMFLVNQYCYEMGYFMTKPYDRKFGNEAITDVMEM